MKKPPLDDSKPVTQKVLLNTLVDFWEQIAYPMIDKKSDKVDIEKLEIKLSSEIKHNRRLIRGLQLDTPTMEEFKKLDKRVSRLESRAFN